MGSLTPLLGALILLTAVVSALSGCSWRDKSGTKHTLILGIGMISTSHQGGIAASDAKVLGLSYDRAGLMIGVGQIHHVAIDPALAVDAIIAVSSTPFSLVITNWNPNLSSNTNSLSNTNSPTL